MDLVLNSHIFIAYICSIRPFHKGTFLVVAMLQATKQILTKHTSTLPYHEYYVNWQTSMYVYPYLIVQLQIYIYIRICNMYVCVNDILYVIT